MFVATDRKPPKVVIQKVGDDVADTPVAGNGGAVPHLRLE